MCWNTTVFQSNKFFTADSMYTKFLEEGTKFELRAIFWICFQSIQLLDLNASPLSTYITECARLNTKLVQRISETHMHFCISQIRSIKKLSPIFLR
jgi:hypothetical protein